MEKTCSAMSIVTSRQAAGTKRLFSPLSLSLADVPPCQSSEVPYFVFMRLDTLQSLGQ